MMMTALGQLVAAQTETKASIERALCKPQMSAKPTCLLYAKLSIKSGI